MNEKLLSINLSYLKELSGGNAGFETDMLKLYVSEVGLDVVELEKAHGEQDWTRIGYLAHKLKSSIQLVGLESLVSQLTTLEGVRHNDAPTASDHELLEQLACQLKHSFEEIAVVLSEGK